MLAYIHGTVIFADAHSLIIRTEHLGYRVYISENTRAKIALGDEASLFLHQHIRENTDELYGFASQDEYMLFQRLIGVSGVGPKSALSVLAVAPATDIISTIVAGDSALLKRVSGIGSKTAERIVLELKGAFDEMAYPSSLEGDDSEKHYDDVITALIHLGYSRTQAHQAARMVPHDVASAEERVRHALRSLL